MTKSKDCFVYGICHNCGELSMQEYFRGTRNKCQRWVKKQIKGNFIVTSLTYQFAKEKYL